MKRKIGKFFIILIMIITILLNVNIVKADITKADVGSFESYDSGSSWGGSSSWDSGSSWSSGSSSWDSGSSWSSSDWGSSSDWDDDLGSALGLFSFLGFGGGFGSIIFWIILIIFIVGKAKSKNNRRAPMHPNINYVPQQRPVAATPNTLREDSAYRKIKEVDEMFRKEEFIAWSKNLFVKLQQAWTARDWETIRTFETNELFEQHKNQLQGYIDNNQINVMDRICVNFANLYDFRQEGDKDILVVRLNSRMADYIIDATTKQVLRGNKNAELTNTYLLTFVRKTGIKTAESSGEIKTTNCPNCGAPTKITSSGKCEYCGSVITTGEHDWALSNLERERT